MLDELLRVTPLDPFRPTPSAPVPPAPAPGDIEAMQPVQDPVPAAPPGPLDPEPFVPPLPPVAVMLTDGELLVKALDPPANPSSLLPPCVPPVPTVTVKVVELVTVRPEAATTPPPPPPPPPETKVPPPPPPPPPPTTMTSTDVTPVGTVHVVVPVVVKRRSHTVEVPATRVKPVGHVTALAEGRNTSPTGMTRASDKGRATSREGTLSAFRDGTESTPMPPIGELAPDSGNLLGSGSAKWGPRSPRGSAVAVM